MFCNLKIYARLAVFAVCATSFSMVPALASVSAQDHDSHYQNQNNQRDWSNNSYYKVGQREAEQDRKHHKQRKHNHHYKNDEDRQAYESGYQNSWNSDNHDHDHDSDHSH